MSSHFKESVTPFLGVRRRDLIIPKTTSMSKNNDESIEEEMTKSTEEEDQFPFFDHFL